MKNDIIIIFMIMLGIGMCGAGWERTYGGDGNDFGNFAMQTIDNGYIVAGQTNSFINRGVYLIKTDAVGDTSWTNRYGSSYYDYAQSVIQTFDGGYILGGSQYQSSQYDPFLVKTDASGEMLWSRTYGGTQSDWGFFAIQTSDSGFVITGRKYAYPPATDYDVLLIRANTSGSEIWSRTYDNGYVGYCVQETNDGGFVVAGWTESLGEGLYSNSYILKTNASGYMEWEFAYGTDFPDEAKFISLISDDEYIVTGYTGLSVWLLKLDSSGDTIWTRTYGGSYTDKGYCVSQTTDGGYIIVGETDSYGSGLLDVYVIKTDSEGNLLWSQTYGGSNNDGGRSISQTDDGGYIIAGYTTSWGEGLEDIYLIKIDSEGIAEWQVPKPHTLSLSAFPNPFNSSVAITAPADAEVEIYDLRGNVVFNHPHSLSSLRSPSEYSPSLAKEGDGAQRQRVVWQPDESIASGIYLVRARTEDGRTATRKVVLLR